MYKIVFLDAATLGDTSLEKIKKHGKLICYPYTQPNEVFERIKGADIIITNKVYIGKEQIDSSPSLKLICVAATGTNNVDIPYASSKGIPVKNVAGYSTESVVQITYALLLSLCCHIEYYDNAVKSGSFSKGQSFTDVTKTYMELSGKTFGIIGLGTIGHRVADIAAAFGMNVVYYSTSGVSRSDKYKMVSLEELLKTSDVVSIHAPLNVKTNNLLTLNELKLMKPTAYLINIGRGGIVNEADLVTAVGEKIIAGAGLDVYTKEPLPLNSPYLLLPDKSSFIFTPHIGWASAEARERLVSLMAENIIEFKNTGR